MRVEDMTTIGAIGSGTMGHAIALEFAVHGYQVHLVDQSDRLLDHGLDLIRADASEFASHGLLKEGEDVDDVLSRVSPFTDYHEALAGVGYVTESVAENMDVKHEVWLKAEEAAPTDAIFATNTSGLSPTKIASVLAHPERFLVAHYWNPAHLMPLVEVVPGGKTSLEAVDATLDLLKAIGKKPTRLNKESLGFVGNRIQMAVLREAFHIVEEGVASAEDVDAIVKYSLGRRWSILGPIASADLGGLDVFAAISSYLFKDMDNGVDTPALLAEKVKEGHLGNKTGQGFYAWSGQEGAETVARRDEELMEALVRDSQESPKESQAAEG